ncbi:MAG: HAD family phosphatase [Planctomycetes bacterium]|nr:HAD family phosphatase [Planctomycetota bacterium]
MRFKLIALDIDGTLLNSRKQIGPRTKQALHDAAAAGIKIVLCTGRRYRSTLPILDLLGIKPIVVVHGGSLVKDSRTHETIYKHGLPFKLAEAILVFLKKYDVSPLVILDAFPHGPDFVIEDDRAGKPEFLRYIQGASGHYLVSREFANVPRKKMLEIALFDKMGSLTTLLHSLKQEFRTRITAHVLLFGSYRNQCDCLEIFDRGTSKWNALIHVAQQFGITDGEIIAAGDDVNDLEMIEKAGFGIAMGNARDELKEVADLVTGTYDEEGVADFVEQILE